MTDILQPKNGLIVIRGTSKTYTLTVTDASSKPVNLTGARVVFTVKQRLSDTQVVMQKTTDDPTQAVVTKPFAGEAEIYLTPADTKNLSPKQYVFDVWVVLTSGKRYAVIPPSTFELQAGVTVL